jgi:hypothetical protein
LVDTESSGDESNSHWPPHHQSSKAEVNVILRSRTVHISSKRVAIHLNPAGILLARRAGDEEDDGDLRLHQPKCGGL